MITVDKIIAIHNIITIIEKNLQFKEKIIVLKKKKNLNIYRYNEKTLGI